MRRTLVITLVALAPLVAAPPAFASGATIDTSRVAVITAPVELAQLVPEACRDLGITNLVLPAARGGGNGNQGNAGNGRGNGNAGVTAVRGTNGNDLILGTSGNDLLEGRRGDDCLVAGAGDDGLDAGAGTDVCLSGGEPGDVSAGCETLA